MHNAYANEKIRSQSALKPKLPIKYITSEEAILNTRKPTIPVPFVLHSTTKSKKTPKNLTGLALNFGFVTDSQRSSRLKRNSPERSINYSPRTIRSALKSRPGSSPLKRVQFKIQLPIADKDLGGNRQKIWKKIFSSIKTRGEKVVNLGVVKEAKKRQMHTIQEIKQM